MNEEIQAIKRNKTQEQATLPKGHKSIKVKQVFKLKKNAIGGRKIQGKPCCQEIKAKRRHKL